MSIAQPTLFTEEKTIFTAQPTNTATEPMGCPHWDPLCPFKIASAQVLGFSPAPDIHLPDLHIRNTLDDILDSDTIHDIQYYASYPFKNVDPAIQLAVLFGAVIAVYAWIYVRYVAPKDMDKTWKPEKGIRFQKKGNKALVDALDSPSGLFSGGGEPVELESPMADIFAAKRAASKAKTDAQREVKAAESKTSVFLVKRKKSARKPSRARKGSSIVAIS